MMSYAFIYFKKFDSKFFSKTLKKQFIYNNNKYIVHLKTEQMCL